MECSNKSSEDIKSTGVDTNEEPNESVQSFVQPSLITTQTLEIDKVNQHDCSSISKLEGTVCSDEFSSKIKTAMLQENETRPIVPSTEIVKEPVCFITETSSNFPNTIKTKENSEVNILITETTSELEDKICLLEHELMSDIKTTNSGIEKSSIFCSTPIVCNALKNENEDSSKRPSTDEFRSGLISPLGTIDLKSKINLKRTNLCLERIEEEDETNNSCTEKKPKLSSPKTDFESKMIENDTNLSSSIPCFEAPAKSILKKWHPSSFPRDSATSFFVLDECGETDSEDDFEVAFKSLAEELLMSSSNIETLEKYHSQVGFDCQMDDQKFDEALQELNYDLDEKSFSTMKPKDESFLKENVSCLNLKTMEESSNNITIVEKSLSSAQESAISEDKPILAEIKNVSNTSTDNLSLKLEENTNTCSSNQKKKPHIENEILDTNDESDENLSPPIDEEDVLLEEEVKSEKKPYVYFEYVSSDPKENEDNYNPEWQKLGKLTSDEERYKAVRDRWRSLVPPDPNRDLTCRQWRKKNNKPPLNIPSLNNNRQVFDNNEKNQLCTAVFERKIANLLQDLQMRRVKIITERNKSFQQLGNEQDAQQRRMLLMGTNNYELEMLKKHHIQECISLKNRFDTKFIKIKKETEEKVMMLKKACDEVLSFQKFYKGVGASDEEVCMYMTDIQVEELMETEEMLERYSKFYN